MVGPKMQNFCPRIDMLKVNCFKTILPRRRGPQRGGAGWKPTPDGVPGAPCQP